MADLIFSYLQIRRGRISFTIAANTKLLRTRLTAAKQFTSYFNYLSVSETELNGGMQAFEYVVLHIQ